MEVLLFTVFGTVFGLLLGALSWWAWQRRELARRQAKTDAHLAALGADVHALAHDLRQTLETIIATTERARHITPDGIPGILDGIERAARNAAELVQTLRDGKLAGGDAVKSARGVVHLGVILVRGFGVPVDFEEKGSFRYVGSEGDALRVVQNLLANAVREAGALQGRVRVEIDDRAARFTNPVRDPAALDEHIYDQGVSHAGSAGTGLSTAKASAARVGWSVRHEVREGEVCFIVEERPEAFPV